MTDEERWEIRRARAKKRGYTNAQIKLAERQWHTERMGAILAGIPERFVDDGASHAPDSVGSTNLRPVFRIHDWMYCTRCHPPGTMTGEWRKKADADMKLFMGLGLPWYSRWVRRVYYWAVKKFGGRYEIFDSCGPEAGDFCRHNMPMPLWMNYEHAVTDALERIDNARQDT